MNSPKTAAPAPDPDPTPFMSPEAYDARTRSESAAREWALRASKKQTAFDLECDRLYAAIRRGCQR